MERDDDEAAAGQEEPGSSSERTLYFAEFVVDVDAQRLEAAGGWIDA